MARATRMGSTAQGIAANLPLGRDPQSVRRRVEALEHLLERTLRIPGTNQTIGLDVILDLIPVGGTFVGAILGSYMVWEARNLGMSKGTMFRMFANVGIDWALGLIPGIGIVPDFFFRSNSRNLRMIRKHLDKHHPNTAVVES